MSPGQDEAPAPSRAFHAAWWLAPSLLCLALYWRGFTAWFRGDDLAWLGTGLYIQNFHDFLVAMFGPQAQGTIRPLSERAFFMAGFELFGLEALPFKIVVFATQFANLALAASIGARITGRRAAGFCAAVLWVLHGSSVLPLGWTCVYNEVMCGFFLLLALHFLLRYTKTGERRYYAFQWMAFLAGFGALELNVVYPVIAAGYTLLLARRYFRGTLPMFAASAGYAAAHALIAPVKATGDYAMHFTGAMFGTLGTYWTWSVGPPFLYTPFDLPKWLLPAGAAAVSLGLLGFLAVKVRAGERAPLFFLLWYLAVLAPVLPLRDHRTEYYVFLPVIGLCWLGGWALAESWRGGMRGRVLGGALAMIYLLMMVPDAIATSKWNYAITMRVRTLIEGVAGVHERQPAKSILLDGVDSELFYNAILDRPFRLFGVDNVYLAPGSEKRIAAQPDLGDITEFTLPGDVVQQGLKRDELVVYDVRGPRLRNVTAMYASLPKEERSLPLRLDAASPLTSYLLGPEWYGPDGDHRWMPRKASLRMGAPKSAGQKLYLRGNCPDQQLSAGPLPVTVTVDGATMEAAIRPGENAFELSFALPDSAVGKAELQVTVTVGRVLHPASDPRDLGLAFGTFEVR
jgi:hypothetical protein